MWCSGLANKKTVTIQAADKEQAVVLATTKTKKQNKPKVSVNKSILKKEFPRMSKAVANQVLIKFSLLLMFVSIFMVCLFVYISSYVCYCRRNKVLASWMKYTWLFFIDLHKISVYFHFVCCLICTFHCAFMVVNLISTNLLSEII